LFNSFQTLAHHICWKRQVLTILPATPEAATGIHNKIMQKAEKKATPAKMPGSLQLIMSG
jgi:hypothetical protein